MGNSTTNSNWNATLRTIQTVTIQQSENQQITVEYRDNTYTETFEAVSGYPYTVTVVSTDENYSPGTLSHTSGTITGDITISATPATEAIYYTVTVQQPENGYITVNGQTGTEFTIRHGDSINVQAYANDGYEVEGLYIEE